MTWSGAGCEQAPSIPGGEVRGMEMSETEKIKHLYDENTRLKKLVASLSLDEDMLQSH